MLAKLLRICEAASIDPGEVFSEVFGSTTGRLEERFGLERTPEPTVLKTLRRRLRDDGEQLASPPLAQSWLDELDELRYNDPTRALATIEHAVSFLEREDLPRALGIWASAARLLVRNEEGFMVCREALRLARMWKRVHDEADLLRRLAYLVSSHTGDYAAALEIAGQAALLYAREGVTTKLGQVVVDQAIFLRNQSMHSEAQRAFEAGLGLVSESDRRHRFAALQGLAVIERLEGRQERALEYVEAAQALGNMSRFERGMVSWLEGTLCADVGRWERADEIFGHAFQVLATISPIDAALSVCDHVQALLAATHLDKARERSATTRQLLEPLRHNPVASAALRDLLCAEDDGLKLTVQLVEAIRRRIEESRRVGTRRQ